MTQPYKQDQGYAWVVLVAVFFYNVLVSIQFAAVGVFLVEFRHYFETSRSMVAWIGSTTVTVGSFLGKKQCNQFINNIKFH